MGEYALATRMYGKEIPNTVNHSFTEILLVAVVASALREAIPSCGIGGCFVGKCVLLAAT